MLKRLFFYLKAAHWKIMCCVYDSSIFLVRLRFARAAKDPEGEGADSRATELKLISNERS